MFKSKNDKFKKYLKWSLVTIIMIVLLLRGIELVAEFYLEKHSDYLATWATEVVGQPIKIESVSVGRAGLQPVLVFHDVELLSNQQKVLLKVAKLRVGVNVLKSFLYRKFHPSVVAISGASLHLYSDKYGKLKLGGIEKKGSREGGVEIIEWLVKQDNMRLSNSVVDWSDAYGSSAKFSLQDLHLGRTHNFSHPFSSKVFTKNNAKFFCAVRFKANWSDKALQFKLSKKNKKRRLAEWLQTVFATQNRISGTLNLYHRVENAKVTSQFLLQTSTKIGHLKFNKLWPELSDLDADVAFDGKGVIIKINSGKVLNKEIAHLDATISDVFKPDLLIDGEINTTDMSDGIYLINHSPLRETIGKGLSSMDLFGPLQLKLHLGIPLSKPISLRNPVRVLGKIALQNNRMHLDSWHIKASDIAGDLTFTGKGVKAPQLTANLFGGKVNFSIDTKNPERKNQFTMVDIESSRVDVKKILRNFDLKIKGMGGATEYKAHLELYPAGSVYINKLKLTSDLLGAEVNLPKPMQKGADKKKDFSIHSGFKDNAIRNAKLIYGKSLQIELSGKAPSVDSYSSDLLIDPEFKVHADFGDLVWEDWYQYLNHYLVAGREKALPKFLQRKQVLTKKPWLAVKKVSANIETLHLFGHTFHNNNLLFVHDSDDAQFIFMVKGDDVNGKATVPENYPVSPIVANFAKLHLDKKIKSKKLLALKLKKIPHLEFSSQNFIYNKHVFSGFSLNLVPQKDSVAINKLHLYDQDFDVAANGVWQDFAQSQKTSLKGTMSSKNWGHFLNQRGWGKNLVDGKGDVQFTLMWPNSLSHLKLANLTGKIKIAINDGQIVELGKKTEAELGVGRFLSLFSLQSLPRRLTLDFRDLSKKGFAFDKLTGDFALHKGHIDTRNATIYGPIAKIMIKGKIDIRDKNYDLRLYTFPHTDSTLPILATLAGGPLAGVATWVASNIFSHEVKKATGHVFAITGPWKSPQIVKTSIPVVEKKSKGRHRFY